MLKNIFALAILFAANQSLAKEGGGYLSIGDLQNIVGRSVDTENGSSFCAASIEVVTLNNYVPVYRLAMSCDGKGLIVHAVSNGLESDTPAMVIARKAQLMSGLSAIMMSRYKMNAVSVGNNFDQITFVKR